MGCVGGKEEEKVGESGAVQNAPPSAVPAAQSEIVVPQQAASVAPPPDPAPPQQGPAGEVASEAAEDESCAKSAPEIAPGLSSASDVPASTPPPESEVCPVTVHAPGALVPISHALA